MCYIYFVTVGTVQNNPAARTTIELSTAKNSSA